MIVWSQQIWYKVSPISVVNLRLEVHKEIIFLASVTMILNPQCFDFEEMSNLVVDLKILLESKFTLPSVM